MGLLFSIKWIYLIESRNFDQKYKFSNRNDMVSAWRNFQKKSCGISTYDNWNFKPQISSIFHFDRASGGQMRSNGSHIRFKGFKNSKHFSFSSFSQTKRNVNCLKFSDFCEFQIKKIMKFKQHSFRSTYTTNEVQNMLEYQQNNFSLQFCPH